MHQWPKECQENFRPFQGWDASVTFPYALLLSGDYS
jgi:hypothetical protein